MFIRKVILLLCFINLAVLLSCVSSSPEVTVEPLQEKTNVDELATLINLDYKPEAAVWQVVTLGPEPGDTRLPGPSDAYLVAVLSYKPAVVNLIRAEVEERNSDVYVDASFLKAWYPQAAKSAFSTAETGFLVLSEPTYNPEPFTAAPWLHGYLFFPADETVFLFLSTT